MPTINLLAYNWVWIENLGHVLKSSNIEDIKIRMNLDWQKQQN